MKTEIYIHHLTQAPAYNCDNKYLFIKEDNIVIGLLSISLRTKLKGIFKYARINNGPLILNTNTNKNSLINNIFYFLKKRGYRIIFFSPYPEITPMDIKKLDFFFKLPLNKNGTIILNLNKPIEELKSLLNKSGGIL